MIPGGPTSFTPTAMIGTYTPPLDDEYTPLYEKVWGGIALNNPTQGRLYQYWVVDYVGGNIRVYILGDVPVLLLPVADVISVSLAFDTNMSPVIAYQTTTSGFLYYYDTITSGYITRPFPTTSSSRVAVDQPETWYAGDSDVIYAYTSGGNLCYRQQRDRYDVEYVIGAITGGATIICRVGLSSVNRLQFQTRQLA